ncbi:MAG TPA: type II toxin-antitoxin system VapC family toxin [Aggregatilinea sp.]|uniref:type II toxin-antitoxin system VapC family toxin n=1 Tax=Aggregatilinea sp. TaxID=2806333 RepID=UPI002BE08B42|nr:type II toxin-antitoxin system VapC family toxin [Aggregatilinea sp.]HML23737.1 type II toxin-antitoxin system VapC family toxin [Aggregatilinea sp.]
MTQVVLDSGILIASVFVETLTPQAKALLQQLQANQVILHAPTLLRYECIAVVRKAVYQGRISPEEGRHARNALLSYPITLHFDRVLLRRGYDLAEQYNRPTAYDAQYLALAERLACDFWTADERLYNAIASQFTQVNWLGRT